MELLSRYVLLFNNLSARYGDGVSKQGTGGLVRFDMRIQKVDLQQEVSHYIEPSIASLPESTRESTQGRGRPGVRRQRSARRNRQVLPHHSAPLSIRDSGNAGG